MEIAPATHLVPETETTITPATHLVPETPNTSPDTMVPEIEPEETTIVPITTVPPEIEPEETPETSIDIDGSPPPTPTTGRALAALVKYWPWILLPFIPMISAGLTLINKAALGEGMDFHVFCVYRNFLAFVVLLPIVYYFERNSWELFTRRIFIELVLLAMLEPVLDQQFAYAGLYRIPASFSSAVGLLQPVFIFVLSCMCRLEQIHILHRASQLKVAGAVLAVLGAVFVVASPWDKVIPLPWTRAPPRAGHLQENVVEGITFCLIAISSAAGYNILLTKTLSRFTAPWTTTACTCLLGGIMNVVVALVLGNRDRALWIVTLDTTIVPYLYSGIVSSAIGAFIQSLLLGRLGPVLVGAASPFSMVIVTIVGTLCFRDQLYLIRVVAIMFLVLGMLLICWGKHKEARTRQPPSATQEQAPPRLDV